MWFLFSIASASVCISFIIRTVNDFNEHSVITNIDVIYEQSSQFPTVSFCVSFPDNREVNLNELMITCLFDFDLNCNWTQFEVYRSFLNETCFRFNSGKDFYNNKNEIKNTSFSDIKGGLILILKINTTNLFGFKASLFIQNHTNVFTRENLFNNSTGVLIPSGNSYITVQREFVKKLDLPYNSCIKQKKLSSESQFQKYFLDQNKTYTQRDCIDLCLKQTVARECDCKINSIEPNEIYKICYLTPNDTIRNCSLELYDNFLKERRKFTEKCLEECPIECDFITYKISSNYLGAQSINLLRTLQNDLHIPIGNFINQVDITNIDELLNDIIIVSVYYDELKYTTINQIPKTELFDLISNIGGTLGLFLGFSFLSLVELIQLFYYLCYILIEKLTLMML